MPNSTNSDTTKKKPVLSPEETAVLAAAASNGDITARDRLAEANIALVYWLARKFSWNKETHENFIGAGTIGLMKALQPGRYNPKFGVPFGAYAGVAIVNHIKRAMYDEMGQASHVSAHRGKIAKLVKGTIAEFMSDGVDSPTDAAIATKTGIDPLVIRSIRDSLLNEPLRLDAPASADVDGDMHDVVADRKAEQPDEMTSSRDDIRQVMDTLATFPDRHQEVFRRFHGIGCEATSIQDVAEDMGVSRTRANAIYSKVIKGIRQAKRASAAVEATSLVARRKG